MPSTFRLMSAEFKKIFKKPSVFIVALLLVATIICTTFLFTPNKIDNLNISYSNINTSQEFYNTFYNSDITDTQSSIHQIFDSTDANIAYYNLVYERINKLKVNYENINKLFLDLDNETNKELKEAKKNEFKNALNDFKTHFLTFGTLAHDYQHILITNDSEAYKDSCKSVTELINYCNDNSNTSFDIVDIYKTNNYASKISTELDYGINFINRTLSLLMDETNTSFTNFKRTIENNSSTHLNKKEEAKKALINSIDQLSTYFNLVTNFDIPIVIINTSDYKLYTDLFNDALDTLDKADTDSKINTALQYLQAQSFISHINNLNNKTNQIPISNDFTKEFTNINKKVIENRKLLDDKISSFKNDGTIRNISFCATEYKLLATSYQSYVSDKIILSITENYNSDTYSQFYGYKFKNINTYEIKENIAKNEYYINNNIYPNSFINSFAFNQNSTMTTTAYDYMYFTLEFCAIIIIFFSMMLMCNLITGETESGTIKLLLVRPFKRSKIITAKLMATIFFVIVFMLFSGLLSFVTGYFTYGVVNANILAVLNGTNAFVIHPLLLMLLNIISLIIDIIFYVIIALLFSIIFRNFAGSFTSCLVIFIIFTVLNVVFPTAFWYSFFPTMNLHLFKYLGNAFLPIDTENILLKALITPVQNTMNILFSLLITVAYTIIILILSYTIFKKRDF